jgi:mannosyltransferase
MDEASNAADRGFPAVQPRPPAGNSLLANPRVAAGLLAVIVLVGIGIRSYRLTDRSIWFDEASSWRTVQFPFGRMLESVADNDHLPLHYILLKVWIAAFGDSLWAMRGLSVLLSGVAMVGVYLFSVEAFESVCGSRVERGGKSPFPPQTPEKGTVPGGFSRARARWIGLAAAMFVAVSLPQIRAAWEVRMYTLGTALVALSSWTLFRALNARGPSWKRWATHAVVTLLLAYTHPYGLFSIAAQVLFLAGYFVYRWRWDLGGLWKDRQFRAAFATYFVVGLGWSAWLPVLLRQTRQVQEQWWAGTLGPVALLNRPYEMFLDGSPSRSWAVAAALICAAGLIALVWKGGAGNWYVFCLAVVPYALGAGASFALDKNIFLVRYLVFAQLFLLVGSAALIGMIGDIWVRTILAAFLVANGAAIAADSWLSLRISTKPGMRAAVAYIEETGARNEPVIVASPMLYFPAAYYFHDRTRCHLFSAGGRPAHFAGGPITVADDLIRHEQIAKLGPGRAWVIAGWGGGSIPVPSHWKLASRDEFPEVFDFQGTVVVESYDIPSPPRSATDPPKP